MWVFGVGMAGWLFFLVLPFLYPIFGFFSIFPVDIFMFHILFSVSSFSVTTWYSQFFLSIFDYKDGEMEQCKVCTLPGLVYTLNGWTPHENKVYKSTQFSLSVFQLLSLMNLEISAVSES